MFAPPPLVLSVGYPSPYQSLIAGTSQKAGAVLVIDDAMPIVVLMMSKPSQAEIDFVAQSTICVALDRERDTAFLLWRFEAADQSPMYIGTSLHAGVEAVDHFPGLAPEGPDPDVECGGVILVQDEASIVRLIRSVVMPRPILEGLAPMLVRQLAARRDRKLVQRYRADQWNFFTRNADPVRAFDLAPIKGRAT